MTGLQCISNWCHLIRWVFNGCISCDAVVKDPAALQTSHHCSGGCIFSGEEWRGGRKWGADWRGWIPMAVICARFLFPIFSTCPTPFLLGLLGHVPATCQLPEGLPRGKYCKMFFTYQWLAIWWPTHHWIHSASSIQQSIHRIGL